jgi:ketosteroid isomerase-like protein
MNRQQEEVWAFVQALNKLWTADGTPERLVDYFAPEMVAICPTERFRLEGQRACVAGWTDFVRAAKTLRFVEKNPWILLLAQGQAAAVAYDFEIDYEMGGRLVEMSGRDLMTLEKRDGRWWLVADHFSPTPV